MLCWKLPCRSKGFIPSHPSKAAGNVFQLDHILSCMADLGWGTLPAPADPEPPLPPCPAFILTSAPRHGAGFAQESTANTKYFSPSPVFFHLFLSCLQQPLTGGFGPDFQSLVELEWL